MNDNFEIILENSKKSINEDVFRKKIHIKKLSLLVHRSLFFFFYTTLVSISTVLFLEILEFGFTSSASTQLMIVLIISLIMMLAFPFYFLVLDEIKRDDLNRLIKSR